MMSAKQLQLIHVAYRKAGLNDAQYRTVLRSVAGVETAKRLTQIDFENVMAVLEDSGFEDAQHGTGYWRGKVEARGSMCGERMARKIAELAAEQRYALPALCHRFSDGRTEHVDKLRPREALRLIEMLKAVIEREKPAEPPPTRLAGVELPDRPGGLPFMSDAEQRANLRDLAYRPLVESRQRGPFEVP